MRVSYLDLLLAAASLIQTSIMRLLDDRYSGMARGVGTARILGRVHSAQVKVGELFLPCAFTIMEGRDVDMLLGLDMLKAHQACIDLEKNVLRIQGREVRFLNEHELPEKARMMEVPQPEDHNPTTAGPSGADGATPGPGPVPQPFPGSGNTLGAPPAQEGRGVPIPPSTRHSEAAISALVNLGATRALALEKLDEAGGNVELAAAMLFG